MMSFLCQKNDISPTCRYFGLYIGTFQTKDFGMQFLLKSQKSKTEIRMKQLEINLTSLFCKNNVIFPTCRCFSLYTANI